MPRLAHQIRRDPTPDQIRYFKQVRRGRLWDWALDVRNQEYVAGRRPTAPVKKAV